MRTATLRRVVRNERAYPWERSPLESIGWKLRPRYRIAHAASFYAHVLIAVDRAIYPGVDAISERREMVKSYLDMAFTYLRMAVDR